ncbi:hypothetical protein [Halarchaeum sp. P4]|uniref:hypothetical protein n=1 Tax=Halarchaeum sp. P4 TaxID=3421639 RepID=UPI003EC10435
MSDPTREDDALDDAVERVADADDTDDEPATDGPDATVDGTDDRDTDTTEMTTTTSETDDSATETSARSLLRVARWVGIGIASLLALVAAVNLYTTVGTLISVWVGARYQPLFRAGFDVVVLLVAAAVVVRLARESDAFS